MVYCGECGSQIGDADKFCQNCGASNIDVAQLDVTSNTGDVPNSSKAFKAKQSLMAGGVLVILIALYFTIRLGSDGFGLSDGPDETVDRFFSALQDDKFDVALEQVDPDIRGMIAMMGPEKRDVALRNTRTRVEKRYCNGLTINSIDTETIEEVGDSARVVMILHCSDGSTSDDKNEPTKLRKKEGKWYITQ